MSDPEVPDVPAVPDDGEGEHRPDGLDLARQITRATAAQPGAPRRAPARRRTSAGKPKKPDAAVPEQVDRDPRTLEADVARLVAEQGWELSLRLRGVFARWSEIVGDDIAEHATPETFTEGKLVVRTDSTAWATQLRLLAPTVVRRLNDELGDGTVTIIDVVGPHGPTWKKGRYTIRDGRGPRDTYG